MITLAQHLLQDVVVLIYFIRGLWVIDKLLVRQRNVHDGAPGSFINAYLLNTETRDPIENGNDSRFNRLLAFTVRLYTGRHHVTVFS